MRKRLIGYLGEVIQEYRWGLGLAAAIYGLWASYWNGLLWFFYLPLYPVFILVISYVLYRLTRLRPLGFFMAFTMIAYPAFEIALGPYTMRQVCAEGEPGTKIYRTVTDVKGFYTNREPGCGGGCREALLVHGFDFVEAELSRESADELAQAATHRGMNLMYFATQPGLYRYSLVNEENHSDCAIFEEWLSRARGKRLEYQGVCIATVPIDAISARFDVLMETTIEPAFMGEVTTDTARVSDRGTQELLAKTTAYSWVGQPIFEIHKRIVGNIRCPERANLKPWDVLAS